MAEEPKGLREQKKARRRQHIIDVTVELVGELGYEKVTVEEVLRRVGISAPTFYNNYFTSKDDVLRAVAREFLEADALAAEQQSRQASSAASRLRNLYALLADEMAADPELCRALVLADALSIYRLPGLRDAETRWSMALKAILAEGQKQGEISRRIPADRLAVYLSGTVYTTVCAWATEHSTMPSIHEALEGALNLFLRGAQPRSRK
ncbi:MAG: TetR/AcrR family transcriptional regulator [bacterium]|nr:TetR/AcrR family transcriptional regulator [bacterium]